MSNGLKKMRLYQNNISLNSREVEKAGRFDYQRPKNYRLTAFPAKTGF
jgi:hypothetical protein